MWDKDKPRVQDGWLAGWEEEGLRDAEQDSAGLLGDEASGLAY